MTLEVVVSIEILWALITTEGSIGLRIRLEYMIAVELLHSCLPAARCSVFERGLAHKAASIRVVKHVWRVRDSEVWLWKQLWIGEAECRLTREPG
jgi:hypothetical protein